jgi:hypothetical protein
MNNNDREQWVNNDEGLYVMYKRSKQNMRSFIKTNKEMIDEIISNVVGGKKKAHYLIYG